MSDREKAPLCPTCGSDNKTERLPINNDTIFDYDCDDPWHNSVSQAPQVLTCIQRNPAPESEEERVNNPLTPNYEKL